MPAAIAALVAFLARVLPAALSMARVWAFLKSLLAMGLFTIGLPLAINWGLYKVASNFAAPVFSTLGLSSQSIHFVGLGGWIATQLQLPLVLSVFLGFVSRAWALKITRGVGIFSAWNKNRFQS